MPGTIMISPTHHQMSIDGELFPYVLAEAPIVQQELGCYKVTLTIYADDVSHTAVAIKYAEDGKPWRPTAETDPFLEGAVYKDD